MKHVALLFSFPVNPRRLCCHHRGRVILSWLTLLLFLPLVIGCNYYRPKTQEPPTAESLSKLAESKIFVVHQDTSVWHLQNPRFNGEVLVGTKTAIAEPLDQYATPKTNKSSRYHHSQRSLVLNLVHVYIKDYQAGNGDQIGIPLTAINRLDIVEKATGKTVVSHLLTGIGVPAGTLVLTMAIVALLKSSCPFVYAFDGSQYRFVGETYGGAIFAPLERNDYMPLPDIKPRDQQYQFKITNELQERQYTNLAELWVVQHPAHTRVLLDKYGNAQTLTQLQAPRRVVASSGEDYSRHLLAPDKNAFLFNEPSADALNSLILTFNRPKAATTGKLVLRAQNSLWLDYLYGEFAQKFGSYYNQWIESQRTAPAPKIEQWLFEQGIPLKVSLETRQGWQLVDYIHCVGPLAARDLVIPVDLAPDATDQIRLKLEAGFMFWELDYAALDFSANELVRLEKCRPQSAYNEKGLDEKDQLAADDARYLYQNGPGKEVTLTYQTTQLPGAGNSKQTAFLRTKGYYEHIRNYENLPNLTQLYAFRKPGKFTQFSKEKYREALREINLVTANR